MAVGPGKYDDLCTAACTAAQAEAAILIIFDGRKGSGFSVHASLLLAATIPGVLRQVADEIERQGVLSA